MGHTAIFGVVEIQIFRRPHLRYAKSKVTGKNAHEYGGELLQEPRAENNNSEGAKAITSLVLRLHVLCGDAHTCATLSY